MAMADTAQGRLYYEVIDLTPPWVRAPETILFHHGIGTTGDIWRDWLAALVGRYRIVLLDVRGCGRSEPPAEDHVWSLDNVVADALAVAMCLSRRTLVGLKYSGISGSVQARHWSL